MVVRVSLDPPHIMGRKWPPKHAGRSQVSGIGCATFFLPCHLRPRRRRSPRCDRTLPGGLSPRIVCPAHQSWAHSTHSAGTYDQLGGSQHSSEPHSCRFPAKLGHDQRRCDSQSHCPVSQREWHGPPTCSVGGESLNSEVQAPELWRPALSDPQLQQQRMRFHCCWCNWISGTKVGMQSLRARYDCGVEATVAG